ncbi:cyclopropane-fatty-acyl-phospholipid synthase family protein [Actinophytocola sp.]|uniref:cyclopropane-fatty-acyl-phospholipid synthase family protein n=1 Tax=Actinophytocola sp. TaxID=1872138 RepID=UPI002D224ED8|nr:cyclopropane-fatty-acyl-phospholipid synthase family protein [Actinophytocola sp.]HYQ67318.1 cyclopropane-fatty-acyl-phospholipid synthase family protein [Actinophytocola sp.]
MTISSTRDTTLLPDTERLLRWPGLAIPHQAPTKAWLAAKLFRRTVRPLPVRVVFPGGEVLGAGGPGSPVMRIVRPVTFFHRLGIDAKIGFGEAYMAGDWVSRDLAALLTPFAERITTLVSPALQPLRRWVDAVRPTDERNTVAGARTNIHRHYDLSNEMFESFLDESMTYSSAWFPTGSDDLHAAQLRKIDGVLDLAGVRAGTHVLEIGTGWGALAVRAARRGARVTTLTISAEQKTLAERRVAEAGVADRVQVLLRDYREARGEYDAVVSVEMIEAVGDEYWPAYFGAIAGLLRPGGRVGLQAITMPHDRMLATRRSHTWIHKYVFPGGQILSVPAVLDNAALAGLDVTERHSLGPHYARTLGHWRDRFLAGWPRVAAAGFDPTFRRMWEFYLAYCEAGFRARYLDVWQFAMSRPT